MTSVNSPSADCHLFVRDETFSFLASPGAISALYFVGQPHYHSIVVILRTRKRGLS